MVQSNPLQFKLANDLAIAFWSCYFINLKWSCFSPFLIFLENESYIGVLPMICLHICMDIRVLQWDANSTRPLSAGYDIDIAIFLFPKMWDEICFNNSVGMLLLLCSLPLI